MRILVVSYSFTGNNEKLAAEIANQLSADHIKVIESRHMTVDIIESEVLANHIPNVSPKPDELPKNDVIIFVAPVWRGKIAMPLRAYFSYLKEHPQRYAFVSISGGAAGPNKNIATELQVRTGNGPMELIDLHIADLYPNLSSDDVLEYRLTKADIEQLTEKAVHKLQKVLE